MSMRWPLSLLACLALAVAPAALSAQTAPGVVGVSNSDLETRPRFRHNQKLIAAYDSVADSTHLAVVTHKGEYFLWRQRPRLTWTISYVGQTPASQPPGEILLIFRTQNPQVPLDSRLVLEFAVGERLEVTSVSAYSDPGPMTSSLFMRFPLPTCELAEALASEEMRLWVGGIRVDFKPDQMEALRDLLSRLGAWPPASVAGGA
ncbi:MAG TPA: hypothetical protein VHH32_14035 [Gemmatimonadales bacterium]|nr:hypothetical protein [Gemmatimonadales bacterium]